MGADVDLVQRLTDQAFIGGKLEVLDELVAADFVSHDPPPGAPGTKEGLRLAAEMVVGAFTDRKMDFDEYLETADGRVVESWAMLGTHTGEAFGFPPSNQSIKVRGIEIWRCSGGKIVEHWGAIDMSDIVEKAQG